MKLLNHEFEGSTIHYYFENKVELIVENWGNGSKAWYIEGKVYSEEDFNQKVKELTNETALSAPKTN